MGRTLIAISTIFASIATLFVASEVATAGDTYACNVTAGAYLEDGSGPYQIFYNGDKYRWKVTMSGSCGYWPQSGPFHVKVKYGGESTRTFRSDVEGTLQEVNIAQGTTWDLRITECGAAGGLDPSAYLVCKAPHAITYMATARN